jgi:chromosome segregation ATPase
MRIEITSQHSHELAAERGRAGDLEEKMMEERSKYHQLADELRRSEELVKMEQHATKEERDKNFKLSMQTSTLVRLRDELRSQVSELSVQLSNTKQSAQSTVGHLESKEKEFIDLRQEVEALRMYKQREEERGGLATMVSMEENQETKTLSPSSPSSPSASISTMMKNQLRNTLAECSQLRTEVTTLRMAINEKDFRLQALREIVGGLEKMVPSGRFQ